MFKSSQFGWVIFIVFSFAIMLEGFITIILMGYREGGFVHSCVLVSLGIILLLFYKLSIEVSDEKITCRFGIGLIRFSWRLDTISECIPVRNKWYMGYGVRKMPGGWIYNVSGTRAIQLSFKNKKGVVRIGTEEPIEISKLVTEKVEALSQVD